MKTFRSLVVLKRPLQELWTIMRDHLVEFAGQIADIEDVHQITRTVEPGGKVHIVNEWRARQQVPSNLQSMLKLGELRWTDRNTWDEATWTCSWTIEPIALGDHFACSGQTIFAMAMAGQGTRVTFTGDLDLKADLFASLGGVEPTMISFVESIVTTIIPRNLRSVVEAAAAFELPK